MSQDNQKQFKTFQDFTNLYELSKTLRFELRPIGKTKELLEEQRVFQKDKKILENYKIAKKYFDKLHKKFINDALNNADLNFEEYKKAYFAYIKKNKDNRKKEFAELKKQETNLRKEVKSLFNHCAKSWKEKYNKVDVETKKDDLGILFEKETLNILQYEFRAEQYPDVEYADEKGEKKNIFESFKGFTTYFTNFHNSRKNFYKDDGTVSAIPTRIINDNLRKFIENSEIYSHTQNKIEFTNEEKKIFELDYYNKCFLQGGIDEYNKIIGDINSKINKYRQDKKDRQNKLPFLKILYKQILEDIGKQETKQNGFIEISNNGEVFEVLEKFIEHNENNNKKFKEIFSSFINNQNEYELDKIYLASRFVNTISNKWFNGWELFRGLILEKLNDNKSKSKQKKKLPYFIPFSQIKEILARTDIKAEDLFKKDILNKVGYTNQNVYDVFISIWKNEFKENVKKYEETLSKVKAMIKEDKEYTNKKEKLENGVEVEVQKKKIENYADSALAIYRMMKYFLLEKGKSSIDMQGDTDNKFYNDYDNAMENAKTWLYYNEFRNYLTKKPFNEDKIKLNFENGKLFDGWDQNKEPDNFGVILKKDNRYYLGVAEKESANKIFRKKKGSSSEKIQEAYNFNGGYYEKMEYKQVPGLNKMIPKCLIAPYFKKRGNKKIIDRSKPGAKKLEKLGINPDDNFLLNYIENKHAKGDNFDREFFNEYVAFVKNSIPKYPDWECFDFNLKEIKDYDNLMDFYKDLERNSWKVWFEKVSEKYINEKIENGELYLFQIYNKDFSEKRTGNKNLHTIYFESIFNEENIKDPVIKLNGQAEIFFREGNLKIEEELRTKKRNKKPHKIIKYKRYTENKILFHCPIKLNFAKSDNKINLKVNELLANNKDINIIGIDRGEKHLAYYSVIDQDGKIIDIGSLNKINNVDYLAKLDEKEKSIEKQQKSWQTIENIKELKQGYISQVIKKICDLAIKYNAIIVFEDLNSGFKRGRQKIKKQIYQKLELALINKLNYLVNKNEENGKAGHFLSAYQLASKIDNFKDIGKQSGIVFYTQASYTSKTCPKCGFRKNITLKYINDKQVKDDLKKLKIKPVDDYFKIEYKLSDFSENNKKKKNKDNELLAEYQRKNDFIIYSNVKRMRWHNINTKLAKRELDGEKIIKKFPPKGVIKEYDINKCLKRMFKGKINIEKGDIIDQLIKANFNKDYYWELMYFLNLILEIRNSVSETDIDYIQCSKCGFHSDGGFQNKEFNGDANGAYNIARKGRLILEKINQHQDLSNLKTGDLAINIEEWDKAVNNWDKFVQK